MKREAHLAYGTQLGWYLIDPSVPTTQRLSWKNKRIKEYNSFWQSQLKNKINFEKSFEKPIWKNSFYLRIN